MPKVDTVGENYYNPLLLIDALGGWLFWVVSILSIATVFVDKAVYPAQYAVLQIAFMVCVFLFFAQGLALKLYFFPRAEDARRQQLLSDSFGVALTHEQTVGYYNNDQTNPLKRLAASTMESAFFTAAVARKMLVAQRTKTLGYLGIYLVALLNRSSNLEWLIVAAQVVFSEDIIARWFRMEWLRMRSERIFDSLNRLFTGKQAFSKPAAQSQSVDSFSFYETTKSTATILLSSKIFYEQNARLTAEWDQIRAKLGI
jgi:hypothetical protein